MAEKTIIDMDDTGDGFKPGTIESDDTDIDDYDDSDLSVEDSQGESDDTAVFDVSEDGTLKDPVIDDVDEGGESDGRDSDGKEPKKEKKERSFKVELDHEQINKAKERALKEGVEPVADKIVDQITKDKDMIQMIEDWNKMSPEEQANALGANDSVVMDVVKSNIPVYNFYHTWQKFKQAKKRGLIYYGALPYPEEKIRELEASGAFKERAAGFLLKAAGFFVPELKALEPVTGAYIAGSEFNRQFSRKVRARVREKMHMHETRSKVHEKAVKAAA